MKGKEKPSINPKAKISVSKMSTDVTKHQYRYINMEKSTYYLYVRTLKHEEMRGIAR